VDLDLTTEQKSRLRRAYRKTFEADDQGAAIKALHARYSELFGVPTDVLREMIAEDLEKNPESYAMLREERASTRGDKYPRLLCKDCGRHVPSNSGELMYHKRSEGTWCKDPRPSPPKPASRRRGRRQVTRVLGGGLPGLGKRG
jgi:hypothetical protein